jgi:hypothetical protein
MGRLFLDAYPSYGQVGLGSHTAECLSVGALAILGGGRLISHKSTCLGIFLMISGAFMNANIRIRPWHLRHVKGSASYSGDLPAARYGSAY